MLQNRKCPALLGCRANTVIVLLAVLSVPVAWGPLPRRALGQDRTEVQQASPASAAQAANNAELQQQQRARRRATVGMFLVVGITLLGVVLLGLVLIWGQRVRRLARKDLPKQSRDELWYLRPDKQQTLREAQAGLNGVEEPGTDESGEEGLDRP